MNTDVQTSMVRSVLENKGINVDVEVPLGDGLWKGIRADFVAYDIPNYPKDLAIECKWQRTGGSTDEKIAYTVLNIRECYPIPGIIICSGGELDRAMAWAKTQCNDRLLHVFDTDEFVHWVGSW